MKKNMSLYLSALLFLIIAVVSGRIASESAGGNEIASEAVSTGTGQIGGLLADILWLQLDQYHHIWMYQGNEWITATDYLPQLWLIIKLDPGFAEAYIDGGYHLAINLNMPEEGLELLGEGARQCPDNERILWEKATVLWETDFYGTRVTHEAVWNYLDLVKRKRGQITEPWNEANAAMILEFTFEEDTLRRNNLRISERYADRCDLIRFARREGFWTQSI